MESAPRRSAPRILGHVLARRRERNAGRGQTTTPFVRQRALVPGCRHARLGRRGGAQDRTPASRQRSCLGAPVRPPARCCRPRRSGPGVASRAIAMRENRYLGLRAHGRPVSGATASHRASIEARTRAQAQPQLPAALCDSGDRAFRESSRPTSHQQPSSPRATAAANNDQLQHH